jgi:Mg-chelatase subunit ChlD
MKEQTPFDPSAGADLASLRARIARRAELATQSVSGLPSTFTESPWVEHGALCAVLDTSDSMNQEMKLQNAAAGMIEMATQVSASGMKVGLVTFDMSAKILIPLGDFSPRFAATVNHIRPALGTNLTSGINQAGQMLLQKKGRLIMLVVTDGQTSLPHEAILAADAVKRAGVEIWTIGTPDADRALLERIASKPKNSQVVHNAQIGRAISASTSLMLASNAK